MPILVAPFRDDAFPEGEEIVFSWTDVADAVGYEVEIADANGTPVVSRKTTLAGCVCALDAAGSGRHAPPSVCRGASWGSPTVARLRFLYLGSIVTSRPNHEGGS